MHEVRCVCDLIALSKARGLPGHWEAFLQLVSTSVIVDQDYFLLRLIFMRGMRSDVIQIVRSWADDQDSDVPARHVLVISNVFVYWGKLLALAARIVDRRTRAAA